MSTPGPAYDLFILGTGMAGMASALFAANRGLRVAMCGSVGGIDFSSGPLDLLAVHPLAERRVWDDPWAALDRLTTEAPEHPYAKVGAERIRQALDEFCAGLAAMGLPYLGHAERNVRMLTPAGTIKPTFRVPASMWQGVLALETQAPCLVVGFKGLKGFSARQIVEVQRPHWPGLRGVVLPFPGFHGELYAEHLAMSLAEPGVRDALAESLAAQLQGEAYLGLPSALGLYGAGGIQTQLEERLGVRLFEIPTLPPSLAGLRLRAAFEQHLPERGVTVFSQKLALEGQALPDGTLRFRIGGHGAAGQPQSGEAEFELTARTAIHAGGRFFGKGLQADRQGIREPVLGLYVHQPQGRALWHREQFFHPEGHPVNSAGLEVDHLFRPLTAAGRPAFANVFAAGSILAHQDWMRQKCGAGLAIATARAAVEAAVAALGG